MRVLKFGGTSVGDAERIRGVVEVVRGRAAREPVVVVVSAQSGVTDHLIQLAHDAVTGAASSAWLRERVGKVCDGLGLEAALVDEEMEELETLLRGIQMVGELSARSRDRMQSFGERISARVVAAAMRAAGLPAQPFMAYEVGLVTDDAYGGARVQEVSYQQIPQALGPSLAEGVLPVVTGFIAKDHDGYITTLGRGGSDYSAAIFGAALGAAEIEIWTDVDGVMTADPRIVPGARSVERLTFDEAAELAYYGAKVIHPATIQPAVRMNIPIRVLNTMRPAHPGTLILREVADPAPGVRSIASKAHITAVHVTSARMLLQHGFMLRMFQVFAEHEVVIDLIATSEVSVTVTTDSNRSIDAVRTKLQQFADVRIVPDKAILCLVGDHLRDDPSLLRRVFTALDAERIAPEMVSVGMSRKNVSLLVERSQERRAVAALHREFFDG